MFSGDVYKNWKLNLSVQNYLTHINTIFELYALVNMVKVTA